MRSLVLILATPRGFCAGVTRAIDTLEAALARYGPPVYARHAIVHNPTVVSDLESQGVVFVEDLGEVPDDAVVVFSAHGVARRVRDDAERRGLSYIDATCPLVAKVHQEVRHHVAAGRRVLLIGHAGHPEVVGTMGQTAPGTVHLIDGPEAARRFEFDPTQEYALCMQTTLSLDEAGAIEAALRIRCPTLRTPNGGDICYATTNRQSAVRAIAPGCDAFVVVGGLASANSQRLVEIALAAGCPRATLVEDVASFDIAWLESVGVLGLSSGASTPDRLVTAFRAMLDRAFDVETKVVGEVEEDVLFRSAPLPRPSAATASAELDTDAS